MRRMTLSTQEPVATNEIDIAPAMPQAFRYDAKVFGMSDLPSLNADQLKVLRDRILEPNLKDLRAWAKKLTRSAWSSPMRSLVWRTRSTPIRDPFSRPSSSWTTVWGTTPCRGNTSIPRPAHHQAEQHRDRRREVPGLEATKALILRLEFDRQYATAYLERWPTPEATNPYVLTAQRANTEKPFFMAGKRVRAGEVVEFNEASARAYTNVFEPRPGTLPKALGQYATLLNSQRGGI